MYDRATHEEQTAYTTGLMLDLPTRNPKKVAKRNLFEGDAVRGMAVGFLKPVRGVITKVYDKTVVVQIENTFKVDRLNAAAKHNFAVLKIGDVEVLKRA